MADIEFDTSGPQPHRCNARIEDLIQTLYTGDWGGKVYPAWRSMWKCVFSTPGFDRLFDKLYCLLLTYAAFNREESKEPYIMFTDPKPYLVRRKKKSGWEKVEERLNSK